MGIFEWSQKDLVKAIAKGERNSYYVIGMLVIADDLSPELADQAIESIRVQDSFRTSAAVKEY